MGEENKLEQAKQGLDAFLRQISPRDHLGLLQFSDRVTPLVTLGSFAQNRGQLRRAVRDLIPDGQTAVYDATLAGFHDIQNLKDDSRINAVVVLTDGEDNQSNAKDSDVVRALSAQSASEGHAVRVYTIAYGTQANRDVLKAIAEASGGKAFEGDPKDIEAVYRSISSFF